MILHGSMHAIKFWLQGTSLWEMPTQVSICDRNIIVSLLQLCMSFTGMGITVFMGLTEKSGTTEFFLLNEGKV